MNGGVWTIQAYVPGEQEPEIEKSHTDEKTAIDSARKMSDENPNLHVFVTYKQRRDGIECSMNKDGNYDSVGRRW